MKYVPALSAITVALGVLAPAAHAAQTPSIVALEARAVPRTIDVLVAQAELKSNTNPSNIAVITGGGLLGGVLAAAQDANRTKKAEAAITPVRDALAGFDGDGLALATTKAALLEVKWLQPSMIKFSKDSSLLGQSSALDAATTDQIGFVEYSYDISPDFASLRVVAKLRFASKAIPPQSAQKPESRLFPKNLAYAQTITSVISLPTPGADMDANAVIWSADGGKAARAALAQGFSEVAKLMPRTLALTAEDVKSMAGKAHPRSVAGGFSGRVVETTPTSTLLWGTGFISAQTLN